MRLRAFQLWLAQLAAFACAAAGCDPSVLIGFDALPDATVPDTTVRGPLSGLPWPSGVHYGNELPTYLEFGEFRGRPVDVATVYVDRNSWQGLVAPGWPVDDFARFPGTLVLNEPLYPPGQGNNTDCAAGAYDSQWAKLGSFLVAHDRANSVIRLGWGGNDPTHDWHADADPGAWITCFRRVVTAIRSTDRDVRIDWSFDPIASSIPESGDPYDLYPGDAYVDIVGQDAFDRFPAARDEAQWNAKCEGPLGLCSLSEFARAHRKQLSVGEWGVVSCGDSRGGDSPFYVRKMVETFRAQADILAYEAYFDDVSEKVCSTLLASSDNAKAASEYKRLYAKP